jgi:glutamate dehydrogenase (NAD(P)+)
MQEEEIRNPFAVAQAELDEAAARLGLDEAMHRMLRWPQREIRALIPLRMDDGSFRVFDGFRVQYNDARGPAGGGLRFHPEENIETIRALAAWMTWRTAVVDLPLGGGQGGVACNPKELSEAEMARLAGGYVRAVGDHPGGSGEIPVGDWQRCGDAVARGGIIVTREAAARLKLDLRGARCAIQGFGPTGRSAALLAQELLGLRIVAVSDSTGGVISESGIDARKVVRHKEATGSVTNLLAADPITNEELLELDVAVLFHAALDSVITKRNAGRVKARISCELSNRPTTPAADKILRENGVFVIPDILANAGGVALSYLERQNGGMDRGSRKAIHGMLDSKMGRAFAEMYDVHRKARVHPRLAATMVAVRRVAEACRERGWA